MSFIFCQASNTVFLCFKAVFPYVERKAILNIQDFSKFMEAFSKLDEYP